MNSTPASMTIPNSQPTSMTQSAPNQQQPTSSGNGSVPPMTSVPGQIPYSPPMMMGQPGQHPAHMVHQQQANGPSSNAPQMANIMPGSAPNSMPLHSTGMPPQTQQFGPPGQQFYSHPPANAPAM